MNTSLPKHYDPAQVESKWDTYWEDNDFFHSTPDEREPFTIVIPPPNVTGVLHMGHILNNTIQDILTRRARMLGKNACWVPGTDHASIATEAKVVQRLRKKGVKKSDLSRDEFMEHAWEWTHEHGGIILKQLRKLGASCDWKRTRFTLEDSLYEAVIDCFIELYERGYIYRGKRMINWDPQAKTALSDEEVIYKEVQSKLYHVRYPVIDESDSWVTIATTRPETILADTAICVHPDDPRYQDLIGKQVRVPLENRAIPIIADEYVEMEFGTGCLKVTPAHDENDYMLGEKHGLDIIDMFHSDGTVNDEVSHFQGLDRFEARKEIVKLLEEQAFLVKVEELKNKVGYSERTDAVIEPRLSLQWFMTMKDAAQPALDAVMKDEVQFHPPKFKNTYRHWMENIRDWCISRQLWWGHRIPAWYYGEKEDDYVIAKTADEALEKVRNKTNNPSFDASSLSQDEDVLDTWFSSWLWPISVFDGVSNPKNEDISYYYPTNDLVTAPEIMFFWVARMIMAGYLFRGEKPFKNVYYNGIVRDKQRRKMSKSLGNSPDPIELIEEYGADGVRVGMLFSAPAGNDLLFDISQCEQGRNFANKIWNAFRFLSMNTQEGETYTPTLSIDTTNIADRWMMHRLHTVLSEMNNDFDAFRVNDALKRIYSLIWDDFCDWYIELSKADEPGQPISKEKLERALGIMEVLMKLLHPFMPFLSEEIWQTISDRSSEEALTISAWPTLDQFSASETSSDTFETLKSLVSGIRNIRAEMNIPPKTPIKLILKTSSDSLATELQANRWVLEKLDRLESFIIGKEIEKPSASASAVIDGIEVYIPLEGLIDLDVERARIEKEVSRVKGFLASVEKKLSNERFVSSAPAEVVARERKKQSDALENLQKLSEILADLS